MSKIAATTFRFSTVILRMLAELAKRDSISMAEVIRRLVTKEYTK